MPEELTQVRLGKIIKDRYPELSDEDQEAVRQHAIAALSSRSWMRVRRSFSRRGRASSSSSNASSRA